jgi:hypothetical protein
MKLFTFSTLLSSRSIALCWRWDNAWVFWRIANHLNGQSFSTFLATSFQTSWQSAKDPGGNLLVLKLCSTPSVRCQHFGKNHALGFWMLLIFICCFWGTSPLRSKQCPRLGFFCHALKQLAVVVSWGNVFNRVISFCAAVGDRSCTWDQQGNLRKEPGAEDILTTPIEHNNGKPAWHNKGACLQPTIGYRGTCAQYHSILRQLQACITRTVVLANADLASCQLRCIADGLNCWP